MTSVKENENDVHFTNNQRTCACENRELAIKCMVLAKVDRRMRFTKIEEIFTSLSYFYLRPTRFLHASIFPSSYQFYFS